MAYDTAGRFNTAGRIDRALGVLACTQGVEDLEEVLSERLQQLPAPGAAAVEQQQQQGRRCSTDSAAARPQVAELPLPQLPDDLPAERARVRAGTCQHMPAHACMHAHAFHAGTCQASSAVVPKL